MPYIVQDDDQNGVGVGPIDPVEPAEEPGLEAEETGG